MSIYPPGSSADQSPAAQETVYVVTSGSLVLSVEDGDHELHAGDSVHLPRGTVRSVTNTSDDDAQLLVVIASPQEES